MIEAKILQGFADYLPQQMYLRRYLMDTWRRTFESFGYGELDTPALEYEEIFLGKMGEDEKLMYRFEDNGGRKVTLRSDQTVPLARVVVQHQNEIKFPFKRYQIAKVWRADAPRKGREREFYQCDADIVGTNHPVADAEILALLYTGMKTFGFNDFILNINHRGILKGIVACAGIPEDLHTDALRTIDKFDKIGIDGVQKELATKGVSQDAIDNLRQFLQWQGKSFQETVDWLQQKLANSEPALSGIENLKKITELAVAAGVDQQNIMLNINLVRGQDYYTGIIFELTLPLFGRTSLAGGGRFDRLASSFGERDLPGVGVGVGLETFYQLFQTHPLAYPQIAPEVLLIAFNDELLAQVSVIANDLRAIGKRVMVYPGGAEKMSKQLKYANDLGFPYVLILGPDEAKDGKIQLKDMRSGASQTLKIAELVSKLSVMK